MGLELPYENPDVLGLMRTWPQHAGALPNPEDDFDWEGDRPLNTPLEQLVIYEMHVRGFTADPSSRVSAPGTYAGAIERLDYLASLGINAIELLPIHEFNELEYYSKIPGTENYRFNYWGYSTVSFFSPMTRFSAAVANGAHMTAACTELKMLVREAHKRGIEVIMDVVFNHTAEGNERGVTVSFRGLDNRVYYMLAPGGEYYNYSGCGNTLNCNQPVVRQFIVDCLRYWVTEFHIDGFRFDLASILTRAHSQWHPQEVVKATDLESLGSWDAVPTAMQSGGAIVDNNGVMTDGAGVPTGTPLSEPPLIELLSEDPVLRNTKLIAEAWDCDGLNQVGAFPHFGGRWAEWNGTFRDTVRNFIKGTDGPWAGAFASALCGSPNIYASTTPAETDWWGCNGGRRWRGNRSPAASINFVTAHDGFTLADLVTYHEKRNQINGENNNDGEAHNNSWNCGAEGPSELPAVNRLRQRQMRNFSMALLLSHGVPMLHMGDEYGHTKDGNNNTYCHDGPLNWFNWQAAAEDKAGLTRFMRHLINFRRSRPELCRTTFVNDRDIQWHGEMPNQPDWSDTSRLVAYTLSDGKGGGLYVAFNTAHMHRLLNLPRWGGRVWLPLVDTGKVAPADFLVADGDLEPADVSLARGAAAQWTADHVYPIMPWSCIVLESHPEDVLQGMAAGNKVVVDARGPGPSPVPAPSRPLSVPEMPPVRRPSTPDRIRDLQRSVANAIQAAGVEREDAGTAPLTSSNSGQSFMSFFGQQQKPQSQPMQSQASPTHSAPRAPLHSAAASPPPPQPQAPAQNSQGLNLAAIDARTSAMMNDIQQRLLKDGLGDQERTELQRVLHENEMLRRKLGLPPRSDIRI